MPKQIQTKTEGKIVSLEDWLAGKRPAVVTEVGPKENSGGQPSAFWVFFLILAMLVLLTIPFLIAYFGEDPEVVVPQSQTLPTTVPVSLPEVELKERSPTSLPSSVPTALPIESWEAAINLFQLTGLRETEALEAAREFALWNQSWAKDYGLQTLKALYAASSLSPEMLAVYERFAKLAIQFDPELNLRIKSEMERLRSELSRSQAQASEQPAPALPETVPEEVTVDLAPSVGLFSLGKGLSPESFRLAYNALRNIPAESNWWVKSIKKTSLAPFLNLNLVEIEFERDSSEPGNPRTTWFKGIFLPEIKEGDKVTCKTIWEAFFP